MRKKFLEEENSYVAWGLSNVGVSLSYLGRYEEALAYHRTAFAIQKKFLGEEHPHIAKSLNNMGLNLRPLKQHKEALRYQKGAVEMACKVYQQTHPDIILYLGDVIYELQQIQDKALIEKIKNELYPLCINILGKNHIQVQNLLKVNSKVSKEKYSKWMPKVD